MRWVGLIVLFYFESLTSFWKYARTGCECNCISFLFINASTKTFIMLNNVICMCCQVIKAKLVDWETFLAVTQL